MDEQKKAVCGNCGWSEEIDTDDDRLVLCYLNDCCFYRDDSCDFWKEKIKFESR